MTEQTPQRNVLLAKRGNFYTTAYSLSSNTSNNEIIFHTLEGYRFKTRARFSTRAPVSKIKWVLDHFSEIFHLIKQIGLSNTLKFLRYAASPKVVYVDCIKVKNIKTDEISFFQAKFGMPLATAYTNKDIEHYMCIEHNEPLDNLAKTFVLDKIKKLVKPIHFKRTIKNPNTESTQKIAANTWIIAGAGNFCASMLVPSIINSGGKIVGVCSNVGASAELLANIFNIPYVYSTLEEMLASEKIASNLLIATPPYLHPDHIQSAIKAGYKVYSEKPVAVDQKGIEQLKPYENYENCMIGFNRRFAPAVETAINSAVFKKYKHPKVLTYIVHLGEFSISMATKNLGGGTTTGSCCHYLDLLEYLAQSRIVSFNVAGIKDTNDDLVDGYTFSCICNMENGTLATLVFVRSSQHPIDTRERIIISGDGLNIVINDFKELTINGCKKKFMKNPKGWLNAMQHFHHTTPLASSNKTPTLQDGIRNCELTFAIDQQIHEALKGMK